MVWYWELTQGLRKTQINTIELCKVFLALVHSKLNVPSILTADFCAVCSWFILTDVSIFLTNLYGCGKKHTPPLHLTSLFGLSGGNAAPSPNTTSCPPAAPNSPPLCLCSAVTENDSPLITTLQGNVITALI